MKRKTFEYRAGLREVVKKARQSSEDGKSPYFPIIECPTAQSPKDRSKEYCSKKIVPEATGLSAGYIGAKGVVQAFF
ncbi:MAG: hypothetical protein ACKVU2_18490 [Saprospiraceae bacterium]